MIMGNPAYRQNYQQADAGRDALERRAVARELAPVEWASEAVLWRAEVYNGHVVPAYMHDLAGWHCDDLEPHLRGLDLMRAYVREIRHLIDHPGVRRMRRRLE